MIVMSTVYDAEKMALSEENVQTALKECRATLDAVFDSPENRKVGITGKVDFVSLDGAEVQVALRGRFWHKRQNVLERVDNFLKRRIPEIECVDVSDPDMLDELNNKYEEGDVPEQPKDKSPFASMSAMEATMGKQNDDPNVSEEEKQEKMLANIVFLAGAGISFVLLGIALIH